MKLLRSLLLLIASLMPPLSRAGPMPPIRTVFVILMENHDWSLIEGNPAAPYINGTLLPMASYCEQYYNPPNNHPSLPNYLWLEAGTNFGINNDNYPSVNHQNCTNHLATLLNNAGISWKTYQEDIDGTYIPLTDTNNYSPRHNPFVYFDDVTGTNNPYYPYGLAHIRPYTELAADLTNNTVSRYNFITPNTCDDMHDCSIAWGDAWLAAQVPKILSSQAYQDGGALFITWDEAEGNDGPIGMIVLSSMAWGGGYFNNIHYDHGSTLLTVQEIFGVGPLLGATAQATDLSDLFTNSPPHPPQIVQNPTSASRYPGQTVAFTAKAVGSPPFAYQWWRDGGNAIPGATNSVYVVANIQLNCSGSYICSVSNLAGSTNSLAATLTVVAAPTAPYAQTVLADSPMAYWRLGERTGAAAHDYVGGFDGQFQNVDLGQPGYNVFDPDTAASFGQLTFTNSVVANIPASLPIGTNGQLSIEVWVKAGPQTGEHTIVGKGLGGQFALDTGSVNAGYRFYVIDASIHGHLANGTAGPDGNWHHLVGVYDNSNGLVRLYVDGTVNATGTFTSGAGIIPYGGTVSIGSRQSQQSGPYDRTFVGTVDEVAIYNFVLTPTQVLNHYMNATNPLPVMLSGSLVTNRIVLSWRTGLLQAAGQVTGPFTNLPGASSPYVVAPSADRGFFRVLVR